MRYEEILNFWFEEIDSSAWFKKDEAFDLMLAKRFGEIHRQSSLGETASWRETIKGRLAEIIVLDQFSRNLFRDEAEAFAYDGMSLILAQEALKAPDLDELTMSEKAFLYMPFMHSESLVIHQKALELFNQPGLETNYDFEKQHLVIIERFGRYPHRNKILGRPSTAAEIAFLQEENSSF
ncbi:DUF924 family protein [Vagococcus salmoninarum]|uniref:DUF924 domain-containing protein n=1 Tax=Vagococcus salmoninarum TaxID=2739 RepID=A0A429ZN64_9ENTE|nr:DUF924 family protein [Vagococcus salmoninarum]RST95142.1 hypothetical protein CBF35_08130 [Vagococcus salmoninarum]